MGIFQINVSLINKFLANFKDIFSKKQFIVFCFIIYSFFKEFKRNSLSAMAYATNVKYDNLQYFFSDSKWDHSKLNDLRINLIQKTRTTASTPSGVLAIDDTACPKPYAKNTHGAQFQHCAPLKREEVCTVTVASAFVSPSKHFLINNKFYITERDCAKYHFPFSHFKSKIELAQDLVQDALNKNISFKFVVIDSWYLSNEFTLWLNSQKLTFISELKSNRSIFMFHPIKKKHTAVKPDELVTLINSLFSHKVKFFHFTNSDGKDVSLPYYSFNAKLKGLPLTLKFIVILGKWSEEDDSSYHILVSNSSSSHPSSLISLYRLRWGIERCFQELKDSFAFDQFQVRHKNRIERYWALSILAHSLVYWVKQNVFLSKIFNLKLLSINDYKKALNTLLLYSSYCFLSKNKLFSDSFFNIKSSRMKYNLSKVA